MPMIQIYDKSQVDALIASAGGLPDPTSASAGDVLTIDSNKSPEWSAIPDELPATTSASAGDVLALDANKDPAWVAPSGGNDGWETIDIDNPPSDFDFGDEVEIVIGYLINGSASSSSWTSAITSTLQLEFNKTYAQGYVTLRGFITSDTSGDTIYAQKPIIFKGSNTIIALGWIDLVATKAVMNNLSTTSSRFVNFWGFVFNASGRTPVRTTAGASNITYKNYVKNGIVSFKRKKANT